MMETIVQWATILSPIIAVLLAWWTSRSSAKDSAKQIAVMQENTSKEIEHLQHLAEIQVETIAINLEMQTIWNSLIAQQADEERKGLQEVMRINQQPFQDMALRHFESQKPERDHRYMMSYLKKLKQLSQRLNQIKQQINNG